MRKATTLTSAAALAVAAVLAPPLGAGPATAAGETCDGKAATIVVPAPLPGAWETAPVLGTAGDDVIVGTTLPDTIYGFGGNDTICGLEGDDDLVGGEGDDRLFGGLDQDYSPDDDFYGDRIEPGPGDDYVDLGHDPQGEDLYDVDRGYWDQVSFRHAAGPVTVDLAAGTATGEGTDTIAPIVHAAGIEGSTHGDHLLGSDKDDWITAGGGDDTVDGRGGDDVIEADHRTERVWSERWPEPGDDVVDGGPGHDSVSGGHGQDEIRGGDGRDSVEVVEGEQTRVLGGAGRDRIWASGTTLARGGSGNDELFPDVEKASDRIRVVGNRGRDRVFLGISLRVAPHRSRLVVGNPRGTVRVPGKGVVVRFASTEAFAPQSIASSIRLTWYGTRRADVLDLDMHDGPARAFARGGNDRISGGEGRDLLDGGPGRDRIDGAGGRDRCLRGERLTSCEIRR